MMLSVVPVYAAILGLVYVLLSGWVIGARGRFRVGIGDGGKPELALRMRVHGNFAEYVPISLILLVLLELAGVGSTAMHALCACLLAGRILHAWGLGRSDGTTVGRFVGMILTFTALIVPSVWLLVIAAG
ncbi:MAG: MAPEG family protein [Pseudomonadota bacterium]|nr:MAPEG family protein [Pseudomonadota bacterium]